MRHNKTPRDTPKKTKRNKISGSPHQDHAFSKLSRNSNQHCSALECRSVTDVLLGSPLLGDNQTWFRHKVRIWGLGRWFSGFQLKAWVFSVWWRKKFQRFGLRLWRDSLVWVLGFLGGAFQSWSVQCSGFRCASAFDLRLRCSS